MNRLSVATAQVTGAFHVKDSRHLYLNGNAFLRTTVLYPPPRLLLYLLKIKTEIVNAATSEVRSVIRFLNTNNFRPAEINEYFCSVF